MNNKIISVSGSYEDCINFITDQNVINYLEYNKKIDYAFIYKGKEGRKANETICIIDIKNNFDIRKVIIKKLTENHLVNECFKVSFG